MFWMLLAVLLSFRVLPGQGGYGRCVDAFAWEVVGSVAGVAAMVATVVFGVFPWCSPGAGSGWRPAGSKLWLGRECRSARAARR